MSEPHSVRAGKVVWRIGHPPEPWAWADWRYAGTHRWDDAKADFRTTYAGDTRYACFVEVLAFARPAIATDPDYQDIEEDPDDARDHPTPSPGTVPRSWMASRRITSADLAGRYCDVTHSATVAALRPEFIREALHLGAADFDTAALKNSEPRDLTQRVASFVYALTYDDGRAKFDGIYFASRHGDELRLWAIFERPGDTPFSQNLTILTEQEISPSDPDLARAFVLHRLSWQ